MIIFEILVSLIILFYIFFTLIFYLFFYLNLRFLFLFRKRNRQLSFCLSNQLWTRPRYRWLFEWSFHKFCFILLKIMMGRLVHNYSLIQFLFEIIQNQTFPTIFLFSIIFFDQHQVLLSSRLESSLPFISIFTQP